MKQDNLEKFIRSNRAEFDVFEPGEAVWDRIRKPVPKMIWLNWKTVLWRAASVVVIFTTSWFLHDWVQKDKSSELVRQESVYDSADLEQVNVLIEAEVYYTSQINSAREEIVLLTGNDKDLMNDINTDMVELDKVFEELKRDLKDNSDNEEVIEAMIQNYRIKLEVLDEILTQLKKSRGSNNKNNLSDEI
jgi:hypothetical protein